MIYAEYLKLISKFFGHLSNMDETIPQGSDFKIEILCEGEASGTCLGIEAKYHLHQEALANRWNEISGLQDGNKTLIARH